MIRVRVRERDRVRIHAFEFPQPIKAGIDHHVCAAIRNQQRRMHPMSSRARVDFAARAEKPQRHGERLAFFRN
jgi:hypothetical protein